MEIKKRIFPIILGLFLTFICAYFILSSNSSIQYFVHRLNVMTYDYQASHIIPRQNKKEAEVVIVDIDEKSLGEMGHWPWPRAVLAKLIRNTYKQGAVVVGLDILFPEPERSAEGDKQLAKAIAKGDTVLSFVLFSQKRDKEGFLPKPLEGLNQSLAVNNSIAKMHGYLADIPILQKTEASSGFISYFRDNDGVSRKVPLILSYRDKIYPSFALSVAKTYLLEDRLETRFEEISNQNILTSVVLGQEHIATDPKGQVFIPLTDHTKKIQFLSAADVIEGRVQKGVFQHKIVLVGTSAIGLADLRATPIHVALPGVQIQASLVQGIINQNLPLRPSGMITFEVLLLVILGLVLSLLLPFLHPRGMLFTALVSILVVSGACYYLWVFEYIIFYVTLIWLLVLMITMLNLLYGYLFVFAQERHLKVAFKQYIPPQQVELISKSQGEFSFEGETRDMSVLFCDIRGFTTISESLSSKELKTLLNVFFDHVTEVIFKHRGTIDKYVGDMVMAFWGAPLRNEDHAKDAVNAAMEIIECLQNVNAILREKALPEVSVGIGISSGEMNVGDMGSSYRRSYTVLGDTVNLGARLESATRNYDVNVLVSENTMQAQPEWNYRLVDKVKVKGKTVAVNIYEPFKSPRHTAT